MASFSNKHDDQESNFSFAEAELQAVRKAQGISLEVAAAPKPASIKHQGFDPYNTSGSFDRKKHWTRVGRR
jgi:hypothetical protein